MLESKTPGNPDFSLLKESLREESNTPGVMTKSMQTCYQWHSLCLKAVVLDVTLSILALIAGGVTLEFFTVARAPLGYQDECGFHLGTETSKGMEDNQIANAS